jgi:hypothetical protein
LFPAASVVGPTFNTTVNGSVSAAAPYSITEKAVITVGAGGTANFDFQLKLVPEPSCLSLIGAGLALFFGLGSFRRKIS